jgi:hypothetical protein
VAVVWTDWNAVRDNPSSAKERIFYHSMKKEEAEEHEAKSRRRKIPRGKNTPKAGTFGVVPRGHALKV